MERIIDKLEEQGMRFDIENDTKESAKVYLSYNTSWQMLKQS